jgi:hypothetical protein
MLAAVASLDRAKLLVLLSESPRRSAGVHVLACALGVGTQFVRRMVSELARNGVPVDVIAGVAMLTDESPALDELVAYYHDDLGGLANLFAHQAIDRLRALVAHGLTSWDGDGQSDR